ncbi:MAG: hypothetical protein KDI19_03325 [Pseudomonadales bacterium]|nr:hypothetical protein [Pseudomonadales bacterium]
MVLEYSFYRQRMTHILEAAASGRSKCRGCKKAIAKDALRFGERLPNPFADGEMTIYFHVLCAAYRRPESLLEVLDTNPPELDNADTLRRIVDIGIAHPRATRIAGAGVSPSGRARCRGCREMIAKGEWRLVLEFFEEGMFNPSGYVHAACSEDYFGTIDIIDRIEHFADDLEPASFDEIVAAITRD